MLRTVMIQDIRPNPFQSRKSMDMDATRSLADEIGKIGLWAGALRGRERNGHVELCFGHRRLEAIKKLGWKDVEVDVVELSDTDMALQSLAENLQREGLNDADRADGIAAYVKLRTGIEDLSPFVNRSQTFTKLPNMNESQRLKSYLNKSYLEARAEVVQATGYSGTRIDEFIRISTWKEENKQPIREGKISGSAALLMDRVAGQEGVKAAVDKGLGFGAVKGIQEEYRQIPNGPIKDKVQKSIAQGKVASGNDVITKARQFKAQATRKPDVPPDLIDVMRGWTERAKQWAEQLDQVASYIDYIDTEPVVAKRWRDASRLLIAKLEKFIQ
jgi:ParB/RepB/Spo0J family partition protein